MQEANEYTVPYLNLSDPIDKPDGVYRVVFQRFLGLYQSKITNGVVELEYQKMSGPLWWCRFWAKDYVYDSGIFYGHLIKVKNGIIVYKEDLSCWTR